MFKPSDLTVFTMVSNPVRYSTRWKLYERFRQQMAEAGVKLVTIEVAYGERAFTVTQRGRKDHVQLRARSWLWHKENALNVGIQKHLSKTRYIAWIDADVHFHRPDWAVETVEMLQSRSVIQLFSHAVDLCPEHMLVPASKPATSFMFGMEQGLKSQSGRYDDHNFHPGYAWAMTRQAYVELGGLLDIGVLGAGDRHMAMGLVGMAGLSMPSKISDGYKRHVMAWQSRAETHIHRNVGYVRGLITHWWHGKKRDRRYAERWKVLVSNRYDPDTDIKRDLMQGGLIEWAHVRDQRMRLLRDQVRLYLSSRNEDSVDIE